MTFGQSSDENPNKIPQDKITKDLIEVPTKLDAKQKYGCSFCHERFRNKDSLDRHIYHHTNEKQYKCSFEGCSSAYTNVSHLRRHNKRVHASKTLQKSYDCSVCGSMFSSKENMLRHFKEKHKEDKYVCDICKDTFNRKQQLKRHTIIHTGIYPYRCEVCQKGAINLKAHIRHRASHIHDCNVCGRIFKHWSGLVAHRKIAHVTEFKCNTCNKVFISQKNLNYHQKVHLNHEDREVFQCTYDKCARFYYEKRNLMAHIRSKHEGRKYICGYEDCGKQISTKQKLVFHLKLHLSEKMGAKSRPCSRRTSVDSHKKLRKDKGTKKVSAVSILTGVIIDPELEKALLKNEGHKIIVPQSLLPTCVNTSDMSDFETTTN